MALRSVVFAIFDAGKQEYVSGRSRRTKFYMLRYAAENQIKAWAKKRQRYPNANVKEGPFEIHTFKVVRVEEEG